MVSGNRDATEKYVSHVPPYSAGCDMIRKGISILHASHKNRARFPRILAPWPPRR